MLKDELKAAGWKHDNQRFRELMEETFTDLHKSWTDEELTIHPREALHFCNVIRDRSQLTDLTDSLILRTLINNRKRRDRAGRVGKRRARGAATTNTRRSKNGAANGAAAR